MSLSQAGIVISGSGVYTPPESISNEELVASFNDYVKQFNQQQADAIAAGTQVPLLESSAEFIAKASGIKSRYVVNKAGILDTQVMQPLIPERPNQELSLQCEMALAAAQSALTAAACEPATIDAVIVACSNMQRPYPAIAIELQAALGSKGFAWDMNVACSSASFGIQAAYSLIKAGMARKVLLVNPEICTAHINFRDRDSHFIFGDACSALVIEAAADTAANQVFEIVSCRTMTQFSNNIRNNFGFLNKSDPSTEHQRDKLFVQQGRQVFKEIVQLTPAFMAAHLTEQGIDRTAVARLWLHQANLNMNQLIAEKFYGSPATFEQAPIILDRYANTSSAGSVIAFNHYHADLPAGALGLLCSFGAGYSIGSIILRKH